MKIGEIIAAALGIPANLVRQALLAGIDALGPDLAGGLQEILARWDEAVSPADTPPVAQSCWPFTPPMSRSPVGELSLTAPQVSTMRTYFPLRVVATVPLV